MCLGPSDLAPKNFTTYKFCNVLQVLASGVSVRVRFEGSGVNNAFVEDESVPFGLRDNSEMLGGWVSPEEIEVHYGGVAPLVERMLDLINQVLTHDVVVELSGSTDIEGEAPDFTAHLSILGFVPVIFRASRSEFCDEVTVIKFICHFPQVVS